MLNIPHINGGFKEIIIITKRGYELVIDKDKSQAFWSSKFNYKDFPESLQFVFHGKDAINDCVRIYNETFPGG